MKDITKGAKGDLFKDIQNFKRDHDITGYSLFQIILIYCEHHELEIDEVGEILKKDTAFKNMFKEDLKFHNEAYFKNDKDKDQEKSTTLTDWI